MYKLSQTDTFKTYLINCQSCQISHLISSFHKFSLQIDPTVCYRVNDDFVLSCYSILVINSE